MPPPRMLLGAVLLLGALTASYAFPTRKAAHHAPPTHKAKAAKAAVVPEEDWFPDPALVEQLDPERSFGAYTLRLPPGLTLVDQKRFTYPRHVEDVSKFQGEKHSDGSRMVFFVVVASAGVNVMFTSSAAELVQHLDDKIFADTTTHVTSHSVYGRINGMETLRQYFKTTDKDSKAHGFQYWMAGPTSAIVIVAADSEPSNTTTLPVAEAAVLTLNKQ